MHWANQKLVKNLRAKHTKILSSYTDDELIKLFEDYLKTVLVLDKGGMSDEAFMISLPYLGTKVKFCVVYDIPEDYEYKIGQIVLWGFNPQPWYKTDPEGNQYIDGYTLNPVCYARYLNRWGYPQFIRLDSHSMIYVDEHGERLL